MHSAIRRGHPSAREGSLSTKRGGISRRGKGTCRGILVVTGSSLTNAETVVLFKSSSCIARFHKERERKSLLERRTILIFLWVPSTSTLLMVRIGVNSFDIRFNARPKVWEREAARKADPKNIRTGSCYVYIGKTRAKMPPQYPIRKLL